MKKFTRILSAALVAMMVLSLAAVASAETPSVYIPNRLAKLVTASVEDYIYPTLTTKGDTVGSGKNVKLNTEGVMHFQFSEKPDWFGAVVSSKDGGWIQIDVDDTGYAELELEGLARQPGAWSWNSVMKVSGPELDEDGNPVIDEWGNIKPDWANAEVIAEGRSLNKNEKAHDVNWYYSTKETIPQEKRYPFYQQLHGAGGDYPYTAGKDYGDYSVTVNYHRNGSVYRVAVTLKNVDLFETGMEGASSTITFDLVNVQLDSIASFTDWEIVEDELTEVKIKPNNKFVKNVGVDRNGRAVYNYEDNYYFYPNYSLSNTDVWYISSVSATYPEGNYIVGAEADYRNDAKNNLYQYKISYAVSEKDVAEIYYRTWDSPFYGLYYKDDAVYAVSGSGNNLNKWYKYNGTSNDAKMKKYEKNEDGTYSVVGTVTVPVVNNNGKQIKSIKKGINSYKSPRVTTK